MSSRRHRVARVAAATRPRRDGQLDMDVARRERLEKSLALFDVIRDGLVRLGIDPERTSVPQRARELGAQLAELPPIPEDYVPPPETPDERGRGGPSSIVRLYTRFRDPATPPPDFETAPPAELLAYVVARAPKKASRNAKDDPPAPACDVARDPSV